MKLEYLPERRIFRAQVVQKNGTSTTFNTELKSPAPKQSRLNVGIYTTASVAHFQKKL